MGMFDQFGAAASDIFGAIGSQAEAKAYKTAARIAQSNEGIAKTSTGIQITQSERQQFHVIGKQQAGVAGAGLSASGSALDLLRSSTSQAALTSQLIKEQGAITAQGYEQEAAAYRGMATAANAAATGGFVSAGFKGVSAIASAFGF